MTARDAAPEPTTARDDAQFGPCTECGTPRNSCVVHTECCCDDCLHLDRNWEGYRAENAAFRADPEHMAKMRALGEIMNPAPAAVADNTGEEACTCLDLGSDNWRTPHERDCPAASPGGQGDEEIDEEIAAVMAEHRPDGGMGGPGAMCVTCTPGFGTPAEDPVAYPCVPLGMALLAARREASIAARAQANDGRTEELREQIGQTMGATWRDGRCFIVQEGGPPATDWRAFADDLIAGPLAPLLAAAAPTGRDDGAVQRVLAVADDYDSAATTMQEIRSASDRDDATGAYADMVARRITDEWTKAAARIRAAVAGAQGEATS